MNQHDGVVNRLLWARAEFNLSTSDRVLQKTPFGFDVSVWEFFLTLSVGARLVMARPGGHQDPLYLARVIEQEQITHIHFVPSMLQTFLQYLAPNACKPLLQVLCSGEALTPSLQDHFLSKLPAVALHNLYGPTEAAIDVTHWACRAAPNEAAVPIGRPIANTQIYILDEFLEPAPIGMIGELYIGGIQVARGYLNRAELTAERFVRNPFGESPHERMYRTGDLARFRPDGAIEYCGRNDSQIKLHGIRVELGEIESALTRVAGVCNTAVVLHEQADRGARLVAYVQPQPGYELTSIGLRQILADVLPEYMVPSQFVVVESFPTTTNGKLDRAALPTPDELRTSREYVAPATSLQWQLADIWQKVLSVERVGMSDDFFELGGHSLSAIQVVARTEGLLGRQVPLRLLFDAPTIERFLARLEQAPPSDYDRLSPSAAGEPQGEKLVLSYAQQRLWFIDQLNPGSAAYNMPLAVRIRGELNTVALESAFQQIVERHEILRASFLSVDGNPYLDIATQVDVKIERSDLRYLDLSQREAIIRTLIQQDGQKAFDLTQAPLLRLNLLRTDDQEHVLMLTMHHIVCDGQSLGILSAELSQMYLSFCHGVLPSLPALPIRYVDFSRWQRQRAESNEIRRQLGYWTKQLSGASQHVYLPFDRIRPLMPSYRGATFFFQLDRATVDALNGAGVKAHCTPFMQLLAVFGVLLARYSGQRDICIGTPITQRSSTEVEGLIGLFLNTLVMRLEIDGDQTFAQLLEQVRATALDAYAHPDLPFEQLLDVLRPERGSTNFFNVLFVLQNQPNAAPETIPGLLLEPISELLPNAKFDLTLTITEAAHSFGCVIEYSTDLFDSSTIERMAGHFKRLAAELANRPQNPMCSLNMLDEQEQAWLLYEVNATHVDYPPQQQIQHLFERHAAATPGACALRFGDETLSYGELNKRSNYIAHQLLRLGIEPDDRVAVCLERGFNPIVAVLAVLKAGACYVAIDPASPVERMAFFIEDSRPRALLVESSRAGIPIQEHVRILRLNENFDWSGLSEEATGNPDIEQSSANLAYLGYTSGSSGTPKAAMIEHGNVLNLIHSHIERCDLNAADRVLQFAALSFDGAVEEIFPTLSVGATLVLRPTHLSAPDTEFFDYLHKERVTVADLPTAFWHAWVEQLDEVSADTCKSLRLVIVGGEKAEWLRWKVWARHENAPRCDWINTYGPTETTVVATSIRLCPDEFGARDSV
ncbi:hypothetical protein DYGSA30_30670 [Dyella sp. GSA-30]|nr:hypothetical protein DYGSA30_30670 [Dyella sp. GSA-30]